MKAKYDSIGKHYNETRMADPFLVERLFYHLSPKSDRKYLDIGCGTGNYTIALHRKGVNFVGIDPSTEMLSKAISKDSQVKWKIGHSDNVPSEKEIFDGILATLTIHHWDDLIKSFTELNRSLKQGGRFVIFTSTSDQMKGYWLNHYFPQMLADSMKQMPSYDEIFKCMGIGGFEIIETEKYFVREDLEDRFLYSGKFDPERYLDKEFRRGISSFSDLANRSEVETGLERLENDIGSGTCREVVKNFANDNGDYLFVVGRKIP